MQKHYSVPTSVHINLPKRPDFSSNLRSSALNIVIMVVKGAFLVGKRPFE